MGINQQVGETFHSMEISCTIYGIGLDDALLPDLAWAIQSYLHFLVLMQQHCHSLHPGGTFNMQKVFLRSRNMVLLSWGKLKLPLGPPPMLCVEKSEH